MPRKDGTGPYGAGFISSRGKKWHCAGFQYGGIGRGVFQRRGGWFLGMAAPLIIAAVRDLVNPAGLLRQCVRSLLHYKNSETQRTIRTADYEILEESKSVEKIDNIKNK